MASNPGKKDGSTPGVRGPRGPQGGGQAGTPARKSTATGLRGRFEDASFPLLRVMTALPRWLIVVLPAVLLVAGLVLTGPWAWLGGIFLLVDFLLLTWLTALSWPVIGPGSRLVRAMVVAALLGITILKFAGRF
jgi:hypothetical protein